jgi:methylated-DNA-[protein]-cysteine S-methyltransferase
VKHPRLVAQSRIDTPLGPLTLAASEAGLAGVWFDGQAHHPGPLAVPVDPAQHWLRQAADQLTRYFSDAHAPLSLRLDPAGTPFQREVWQALRQIPPGATTHYGELAAALGRPQAARAVGAAVGRNPLSIVIPCHRVIGRDGSLTGYAGGLARKQALLALEGSALQAPLKAAA